MSKLDNLVAQKDDIVSKFSLLVCADCLPKLEAVGKPISERLASGKKLRFREVKALVKCLCPRCIMRVRQNARDIQC